jgi:hypothetical protein
MPTDTTTYVNWHELPETKPKIDFDQYRTWEREQGSPYLISLGYELSPGGWYTSEGDSFGPLSRSIHATKDGARFVIWYG